MNPLLLALASCLLLVPAAPAADEPAAPAPRVAPTFLVIFESGSGMRPSDQAERMRMQREHLANLDRLAAEGKCLLAGPLKDGGRMRGTVLVRVGDADALEAEFGQDPFVRADLLRVRAMTLDPTTGRLQPIDEPFELEENLLLLAEVPEEGDAAAARKRFVALERTLRAADDSPLALGGPITGDDEIVGMLLFRATEKERVQEQVDAALGDDAPLTVRLLGQYCAKGALVPIGAQEAAPPVDAPARGAATEDG